jgi:thioredoxin reductase (NADPH)
MIETDALIIGAGPAGLFQAFQLGLQEVHSHIVDALPYAGGQCIELYPDKPIYDIPGIPLCSGRELVANLLQQVAPFEPTFHLGQLINSLEQQSDGRFLAGLSGGDRFLAKCVFIAAGVGAFQPKLLKVEGIERFLGTQLFYHPSQSVTFAGQRVLVVGGDDAALTAAIGLASLTGAVRPANITLLHRREVFQASTGSIERIDALRAAGLLQFQVGQVSGYAQDHNRLSAAHITDSEGQIQSVPLDALLVFMGLSPKLGPIAQWGLEMERKQLPVDTAKFSTPIVGIFAVGDVNTYPGKKKLILSAFHECTLAAFGAAALIFPDKNIQLEYTTSSTRLHRLLGVDG